MKKIFFILIMLFCVINIIFAVTSIGEIQLNSDDYIGSEVEIEGVITIGISTISENLLKVYVQDESGFGILLFDTEIDGTTDLLRGTKINAVGTVTDYNGLTEITDFTYTIVEQNQEIPITELTYNEIQNYELYEGTFTNFSGVINDNPEYVGGGYNIILRDADNQSLTIRVWGSTNIDVSQYAVNDTLSVNGIINFYNSSSNIVPGYNDDIEWSEGTHNQDPPGYYGSAIGLYEDELFSELHSIISGHNSLGYNGAKEEMFGYIDNENGQVLGVYTGEYFSIPEGGMPNQNTFNCEHTWPQSWFDNQATTQKADLHHLFPTFSTVNSARGNLAFDNVANISDTYGSGDYVSYRGQNENGVTVWEPADQHKGDVARAMLYFAVRYNMDIENAASDNGYYNVDMLDALLDWVELDPVSTKEINRNEAIFELQNNRNPFVDHPEFIDYIWNGVANNNDAEVTSSCKITLFPNPFNPNLSIQYSLAEKSNVCVKVYNIRGQIVKNYQRINVGKGIHKIVWDGKDEEHNSVSSGVYFIKIDTNNGSQIKKALMMK